MQITEDQLAAIAKTTAGKAAARRLCPDLNHSLNKYGITAPAVAAMFIAQVMHESAEFTRLVESFNYSTAERLFSVFKSDFKTLETARQYLGNPKAIANFVYANQNGNSHEASGDGWNFRGRGYLQITGRFNYLRVGRGIGLGLHIHPEWLEEPAIAIDAACWWWRDKGLSIHAEHGALNTVTKIINGGLNGIEERRDYWSRAKRALGVQS